MDIWFCEKTDSTTINPLMVLVKCFQIGAYWLLCLNSSITPTTVSTSQLRPVQLYSISVMSPSQQEFILYCYILYVLLVGCINVLLIDIFICRDPSEKGVIEAGPDGQDPKRQEWFTKYFSF